MKVASYFTLKNADERVFRLWIETLPIRLRPPQIEAIWLRSYNKKAILWTEKGFKFF